MKFDKMGKILKIYDLEGMCNLYIIVIMYGIIVFSDYLFKVVIVMIDEGCFVWKYESEYFKYFWDLSIDLCDNIYIVDIFSNSIYVLMEFGEVIRVFENFLSLYFFKIYEEKRIVCMCSNMEKICIY